MTSSADFVLEKCPRRLVADRNLAFNDSTIFEAFTDGRYVYDPLFGPTPVPKGDYDRMIRGLNPGVRGG